MKCKSSVNFLKQDWGRHFPQGPELPKRYPPYVFHNLPQKILRMNYFPKDSLSGSSPAVFREAPGPERQPGLREILFRAHKKAAVKNLRLPG